MLFYVQTGRSAENQRVGNITVAAWQMEERTDQRMSMGRLPESINGRVRGWQPRADLFIFLVIRVDIFHDWPTLASVIISASSTNVLRLHQLI